MALLEELKAQADTILRGTWDEREGRVVPDPKDVGLGNCAVSFKRATVLYADLEGSTTLVNEKKWFFAAEIYKCYLHCVAKLVRNEGGDITSYDGDRLMGVFVGNQQSTSAARRALKKLRSQTGHQPCD